MSADIVMVDPQPPIARPSHGARADERSARTGPCSTQPASRGRVVFLDVLRLLAALQMIQGHTLDALLAEPLRSGPTFRLWTFVRGLTSVTFLLTAGLSFALVHVSAGPAQGRLRRLKRGASLLLIGYLMHAPLGILFGQPVAAAFADFLTVDVLQCIGVSLLAMEALASIQPDVRKLSWLSGALAGLCFALAPLSERWSPQGPLRAIGNYFSARGGSIFPLLPWGGLVLAGLSLGLWLMPLLRAGRVRGVAVRLLVAGGACIALGSLLSQLGPRLPARVSPAYFGLKLGLVLLLAAVLVALCEGRLKLPQLLRKLAGETLFLYVSHVLLLYAGHVGLSHWVGHSLPLGLSLLVALGLLALGSAGALGYRHVAHSLRGGGGRGTPRAQPPLPSG